MSEQTRTTSGAYEVMRRMFEEGFATGDGAVVDELRSPTWSSTSSGWPVPRPRTTCST